MAVLYSGAFFIIISLLFYAVAGDGRLWLQGSENGISPIPVARMGLA